MGGPATWYDFEIVVIDSDANLAGTGFSTGSYDTSEVEIAEDMYHFLQAFFHRFPQYNKKFHITGESYGGHYVPVVTAKIIDENKRLLSKLRICAPGMTS